MSQLKSHILILIMVLAATVTARGNSLAENVSHNVMAFLPAAPDSTSAIFTGDFYRWIEGKKLRGTERGEMAKHDSGCGLEQLCAIFGEVMGIDINGNSTPAIHSLITHVAQAGNDAALAASGTNCRKRPFVLMNEQPWGDNDAQDYENTPSSYPASHATKVWSTALTLAQMAPNFQDSILGRAMECAKSDVITGAHWQSDIDAAMLCASAIMASVRNSSNFNGLMTAARTEYMQITGLSESDLKAPYPSITKILEKPATFDNIHAVADIETLWKAKQLRSTERGEQAIADASTDDGYIINAIAACSPSVTISESNTPSIVMFIKMLKLIFNTQATSLKKKVGYRKRPYLQFNEPFQYYSEEWELFSESSYPSRHAMMGWGLALALAEVMPDCQSDILKWGYEYGESRIIKGMNFYSDVKAARVMAACDLVKLHNEPQFKTLLLNAKNEYQQLSKLPGDVNGDGTVSSVDVTALYNWLLNNDDSNIVNGDQDGDGTITATDIAIVYNILLGQRVEN
ncbi:MAG: phosphatase PAP2 family protein [Muribaculaceae bacterium]|nr:phosphatase PAP2 family protein [Muribaculaceae bacterium]